jgi:hypothetical protein
VNFVALVQTSYMVITTQAGFRKKGHRSVSRSPWPETRQSAPRRSKRGPFSWWARTRRLSTAKRRACWRRPRRAIE